MSDIEPLIARFEAQRLPNDEWGHREHLLVATWYLLRLPYPEAVRTVREGILKLNAANGIAQTPTRGYHETITLFLLQQISATLGELAASLTREERLEAITRRFADFRGLMARHYSPGRLESWTARTSWVAPDLGSSDAL